MKQSIEERVKAILAAVEGLVQRRLPKAEDEFDPMDAPGQYKSRDTGALNGRAVALARIAADHKRIEEINAQLPSR